MIEVAPLHAENIADYAAQTLDASARLPTTDLDSRRFQLPFLNVTARFTDSRFAECCARGLAHDPLATPPCAGESRHIEVRVLCADNDEWPAPLAWSEPSFSPTGFDRVITGHRLRGYYYHEHRFWQFYDPDRNFGVQSMAAADRLPPWETSSPLRTFLHWAYDCMGFRLAHAATLGHAGRGVLLAGPGGSGKSGTTLAGITQGLCTVGDDYVLLEPGAIPRAHAVFTRMKQDVAGFHRAGLDPWQIADAKLNWQNKLEFDPQFLRSGARVPQLEIVGILVPTISHGQRTTFEPISAAGAMLALAPSGLFQMPGCAANGVRFFADFVRRTPAFRLRLSQDAAEIADAIFRFLTTREDFARAG